MALTHLNARGEASMVDVTEKELTAREAVAEGYVYMQPATLELIHQGGISKGDVLSVARIAAIQAAKKCSDLIPLCHPLALSKVQVDFNIESTEHRVKIICLCKLKGQTGVEMEALTATSVAALTLFDMCKGVDKSMRIDGIRLVSKKGGKSGDWSNEG